MFRHLNLSEVFPNPFAMPDLFLEKEGHRMEAGIQLTIHCSPTFPNLLLLPPLQTQKMLSIFSLFSLYHFHY